MKEQNNTYVELIFKQRILLLFLVSTNPRKVSLAQFKIPLFQNNHLPEISTNFTILLISQTPIFQAQGALVFEGEFINYQGVDLQSLLQSKGSCNLENFNQSDI